MGGQVVIMMCWTCVCTNVLRNPIGQHCSIAIGFICVDDTSEENVYRAPCSTGHGVFHSVGATIINSLALFMRYGSLAAQQVHCHFVPATRDDQHVVQQDDHLIYGGAIQGNRSALLLPLFLQDQQPGHC